MSRGLLDTGVLIATDLQPLPGELAVSVISLAELHHGVLVARATRLARLTGLRRCFDPLPVDEAVAASYGRLAARIVHLERRPGAGALQLLVAATAHAHHAIMYTRDPSKLHGLEDLIDIVAV